MKNRLTQLLLVLAMVLTACQEQDEKNNELLPTEFKTVAGNTLTIAAPIRGGSNATYQWSMKQAAETHYSLTHTDRSELTFLANSAGIYKLDLTMNDEGDKSQCEVTVTIEEPTTPLSPYIAKIEDFLLAPGQFTNKMPVYEEGDTKASMIAKIEKNLVGKKNGGLISLGGFGGYITFRFDHTVVNVKEKRDIWVMGNAFYSGDSKGGQCEPGIILVAYDANKNGVADKDEWYEIAGSEYHKPTTIKNYEITYYRPTSEEPTDEDGGIKEYIRWKDNQGNEGYKSKNMFHSQSYFPLWIAEDEITFKGTLLPNNAINEGTQGSEYWVLYAYGFGYADNVLNTDEDSAFDIDWAVNAKGERVQLPGVDFVKIYTGINQEAGWLGEVSTEIAGAYDMHLEEGL